MYQKVPSKNRLNFGDSVVSKDYFHYKKQSLKDTKLIPNKKDEHLISPIKELVPNINICKDVKDSGVQAQPNILYRIFYESLEQNKKLGISDNRGKLEAPVQALRPSTIIYNKNRVTQEVIPKSQYEIPSSNKKIDEEINNSIKDIIFNDGLLEAMDDNMSDDHDNNNEILKNLEDKNLVYYKKEYTEVIEEDMIDIHDDNKAYQLVDWNEYPEYIDPKNQILLKASSLFNNSIIMDNRYLIVYCKTERYFNEDMTTVVINLTYRPKMDHLTISTNLLSHPMVLLNPALLINQPMIDDITQSFIYECRTDSEMIDFPKLQISLSQYHNYIDFLVPIPFSINKFSLLNSNNPDIIYSFLEQVI